MKLDQSNLMRIGGAKLCWLKIFLVIFLASSLCVHGSPKLFAQELNSKQIEPPTIRPSGVSLELEKRLIEKKLNISTVNIMDVGKTKRERLLLTDILKNIAVYKIIDQEKAVHIASEIEKINTQISDQPIYTDTIAYITSFKDVGIINDKDLKVLKDYFHHSVVMLKLIQNKDEEFSQDGGTPDIPIAKQYIKVLYKELDGTLKVQLPSNWVSTLKFNNDRCTSNLIGPRVMLTAAHCIYNKKEYNLKINGIQIKVTCQPHPRYRARATISNFDYALCYLSKDFPQFVIIDLLPKDDTNAEKKTHSEELNYAVIRVRFEQLSLDPKISRINFRDGNSRWILSGGFGCTFRDGKGRDGLFRAGYARISLQTKYKMRTGYWRRNDSVVSCAGDSGGAAYRLLSKDLNPFGPRRIIAINTENIIRNGTILNFSFMAKTSSPTFRRFLKKWQKKWNSPPICGVTKDIQDLCHQ